MYWALRTSLPAVSTIWLGDSHVVPGVGHRTDPVLGLDLVFSLVDGECTTRLQGPVTTRHTYPHVAGAEYIGVRFVPGAVPGGFDVPLGSLSDDAIPVTTVGGLDCSALAEALLAERSLARRGELVRGRVAAGRLGPLAPDPIVTEAIRRLDVSPRLRISSLACDLGVSERELQRRFQKHVGLAPRHAARLRRVTRLVALIDGDPAVDLSRAALAAGFYDHAHMAHETRRVLDATPSELAEDARSQQRREPVDVGHPAVEMGTT